ncbi:hypothetical protein Poly59_50420 [Rubripirellula reticaptiva]|uniref:Uncharacterized protein n=1 Tax=Rubripirellula reticaptiva TaxID=2528013 RepID=A0A5C6EKS3_9BACT|nr:hypothetical protein Poly59_50420 [Rubripirellula reticaptiva]
MAIEAGIELVRRVLPLRNLFAVSAFCRESRQPDRLQDIGGAPNGQRIICTERVTGTRALGFYYLDGKCNNVRVRFFKPGARWFYRDSAAFGPAKFGRRYFKANGVTI